MHQSIWFITGVLALVPLMARAQPTHQIDTIPTASGNLEITCLGHGTLMFRYQNTVIHVDPVSRYADYSKLPQADIILITHGHGDHFDQETIARLRKETTTVVLSPVLAGKVAEGIVMQNGEKRTVQGFPIEAVPAYNLVHMRSSGQPYHPQGEGNGYVVTFGDLRVYVAGDTENTPEMKALKDIDVAFLPMNLPYTMTPEMVADAARAFRPGILYPYHYGDTDPERLVKLLSDAGQIEVRIRDLQ